MPRNTGTKLQAAVEKKENALFLPGVPLLALGFLFTPVRPVQFFCLFLILLVLGSKAYSEYLAGHIRLIRRDKELRVFRYEWLNIEIRIENSGRLPAFLHFAEDSPGRISVFRNIKHLFTLGGKSSEVFRWEAYCSYRGVYTLGPASFYGSDPLGLFPFRVIFVETAKLFVYPAPAFADFESPGGIPLGNLITTDPFNEDITRPRSLRDYNPGDDSRRINWKASVKFSGGSLSSLLVNEYELSLSYPLIIFLNVDPKEYSLKNRTHQVERVIEAAAAVCLMAARDKQSLGLIVHTAAQDGATEADVNSISPAAFTLIPVLERLAALEPFRNQSEETPSEKEFRPSTAKLLEKGKTLPLGTRLFYVGPALEENDYNALETLVKRRLTLEFLISDEKKLEIGRRGSFRKYQIKENGYEIA